MTDNDYMRTYEQTYYHSVTQVVHYIDIFESMTSKMELSDLNDIVTAQAWLLHYERAVTHCINTFAGVGA